MKLHRKSAAAIACVFVLGACEHGDKANDLNEEESPPIPVEVSLPARGDVYAVYSGTAPIEAFAQADVIAKVPGEVREILVEEGDDVESGQILARLDGDRLRLELNESQARLRKLKRDFQRNKDLREKGLISEGDFEKIQYGWKPCRLHTTWPASSLTTRRFGHQLAVSYPNVSSSWVTRSRLAHRFFE